MIPCKYVLIISLILSINTIALFGQTPVITMPQPGTLSPGNPSALAMKSNYHSACFEYTVNQAGWPPKDTLKVHYPRIYELMEIRNNFYRKMDETGYTEMPKEAYEAWLKSVNEEKERREHDVKYNEAGTLHAQDILKQHGYDKEPLTLSKGRYKETFINENVMQIGTVLIDTRTDKVVKFLEEDNSELAYKAENTSRFLSPDPLAEKYPWLSPYVYCANNPIRFKDPTGMYIVGTDGKPVIYNQKNGWSANASADVQKIGNAMMLTEAGTKHLNEMLAPTSQKISIEINSDVKKDGNKYDTGLTKNKAGMDSEGNLVIIESKITVYEGSIRYLTSEEAGDNQIK